LLDRARLARPGRKAGFSCSTTGFAWLTAEWPVQRPQRRARPRRRRTQTGASGGGGSTSMGKEAPPERQIGISGLALCACAASSIPRGCGRRRIAAARLPAGKFPRIEINGTFYSLQRPSFSPPGPQRRRSGFRLPPSTRPVRFVTHMTEASRDRNAARNFLRPRERASGSEGEAGEILAVPARTFFPFDEARFEVLRPSAALRKRSPAARRRISRVRRPDRGPAGRRPPAAPCSRDPPPEFMAQLLRRAAATATASPSSSYDTVAWPYFGSHR